MENVNHFLTLIQMMAPVLELWHASLVIAILKIKMLILRTHKKLQEDTKHTIRIVKVTDKMKFMLISKLQLCYLCNVD